LCRAEWSKIYKRFKIVFLFCPLVISLNPKQEVKMEETFYDKWLYVGNPDHRYTEEYKIIPLEESTEFTESISIKVTPGYTCLFTNRLRNSNCQTNLHIPENPTVKVEKINTAPTRGLYNCAGSFLAEHHGIWAIYDATSFTKAAGGNWGNTECSYYCFDSGFYIFDQFLMQYSAEGRLQNKIFLSAGADINRHEVALIKDYTISSGYLRADSWPDGLPGNLLPSGQLESYQSKDLAPGEDPDDIQELLQPNMLAFAEDNPLIPVYLDRMIVQPLENKIALVSYDLKILKVLTGDFQPLAVSSNENSILYVAAFIEDKMSLFASDIEGHIILKIRIPEIFGACASPPAIAKNGNIYWVGERGFAVFDEKGELLWKRFYPGPPGPEVYPMLYKDVLTICSGTNCTAYNSSGDILFNIADLDSRIHTPLISNLEGRYFVGTEQGLYEIMLR
jgi:hypothetical protein